MEPQVMRKMKAAVKAKLIDLEAYVSQNSNSLTIDYRILGYCSLPFTPVGKN